MLTLLTIGGGVALILFGVRFLRKGLDRLFGPKLAVWMQKASKNRFKALVTGLGVSLVAPSSTTISVLAVSTVQAGHLSATRTLAIMFGADIGLTGTVLLISFNLEQYAPVLALFGVALFQFTQRNHLRGIGQILASFSFIFIGIATIKAAVNNIDTTGDWAKLIQIAEHYPWALALFSAGLAVCLQSSTATIGLVIALGAAGTLGLPVALAVVAGANVGIAITTFIIGFRTLESRHLAAGNLMVKTVICILVLLNGPAICNLLEQIPGTLANQVAAAHTGFNIGVALLGIGLIGPIHWLACAMFPAPTQVEPTPFGPRHLDAGPVDSPMLALGMSMRELVHTGEIVRRMLSDWWICLKNNDIELAKDISQRDDHVDLLDIKIKRFLTRTIHIEGDGNASNEQIRQLSYLNELENIGDIIDKNLVELAIKKATLRVDFSEQGWEELEDFHRKVCENLLIADMAFTTQNKALAQQLLDHKEYLRNLERQFRDRHFTRLNEGLTQTHETSAIHLDILTHLKRINSHISHVVYSILIEENEESDKLPDTNTEG